MSIFDEPEPQIIRCLHPGCRRKPSGGLFCAECGEQIKQEEIVEAIIDDCAMCLMRRTCVSCPNAAGCMTGAECFETNANINDEPTTT